MNQVQEDYVFNQGMLNAYDLMDRTISGAIKRNGGATTALQIINVFNEFTSHLHYQKSLTKDSLDEWEPRDKYAEQEEVTFAPEIKQLTDLLSTLGYVQLKGVN